MALETVLTVRIADLLKHLSRITTELPCDVAGVPVLAPAGDRAIADFEDRRHVKRDSLACDQVYVEPLHHHRVFVGNDRTNLAAVDHARSQLVVLFEFGACRITSADDR